MLTPATQTVNDMSDFVSPFIMGIFDAEEGNLCLPEIYFVKDGQKAEYVQGYEEIAGETLLSKQIKEQLIQPDTEEWRLVPDYPNYRVSNLGRVQSNFVPGTRSKVGDWRDIKPYVGIDGYPQVVLICDGQAKSKKVHALILTAFVGPRQDGMVACHNNGIRDDNRLENLRWDSYKGNEQDKLRHGTYRQGDYLTSAKLSNQEVLEILDLLNADVMQQKDIAKAYGVSPQTICDIKMGRKWQSVTNKYPNVLTDAEMAAELEDLVEDIADRQYHASGAW